MVSALEEADTVFAEDTRRTGKLTGGIRRMYSYGDHNSTDRLELLEKLLVDGETVALVTDAGTPGVSDPAYRAVRTALEAGAVITVVPGPSAVTAALAGSGLPVDRFSFEGFLPRKAGRRRRRLEEVSAYPGTLIFFVGPHHLAAYLAEMLEVLGSRRACVARELTKVHEEFVRGTLEELVTRYSDDTSRIRGEITLLVAGTGAV
jgi:16S rRNA (cytidine1402-2'-O)-methyltransferase